MFGKRKNSLSGILPDDQVPASLPKYGLRLETITTDDYSVCKPEFHEAAFHETEKNLHEILGATDRNSTGEEGDPYIDAQLDFIRDYNKKEIEDHKEQIKRIENCIEMRKQSIQKRVEVLEKSIETIEAKINELKDLEPQFVIYIGHRMISVGFLATMIAMIVDAFVNYSFLQTVIYQNWLFLWITVICLSVLSDGSMGSLGVFISRKDKLEKDISKKVYNTVCVCFLSMFVLSAVTSFMIRFGSMDTTFGTVNAAGEMIGKDHYSLAEYGVALITSFVTTSTGIMSFAFNLNKNAHDISNREHLKKKLRKQKKELEMLQNEKKLLEEDLDLNARDGEMKEVAKNLIDDLGIGLKIHNRLQMAVRINDPDFTEKMKVSSESLLRKNKQKTVNDN